LRVKGISKASKKMSRDAKEGVVAVSGNETKTSVIELIVKQTLLQKMKISQILLKNLVN
jgi:translation elongation factor EF-Ts